jgi:hypothetical protein
MRQPNAVGTVEVKLSTTPQVRELLELLAKTGRFGKNASEVGEELMRARLREVELDGWLERTASRRRHAPRPARAPRR